MNWLCWHVGTVTDPKFRVIAKRVNTHPGVVVAVWAYLLELAGSAKDRGSIQSFDGEIAEEALGFDIETIRAIFDEFEDRGLIEGVQIAKWRERQNLTNAERAREWREQRKAAREQTEQNDVREHTRAFANTTDIQTDTQTDILNKQDRGETKKIAPSRKREAAVVLPPEWVPSESENKFALEMGLTPDEAAREAIKFRAYWVNGKGGGTRRKPSGWASTWQNWISRTAEKLPRGKNEPSHQHERPTGWAAVIAEEAERGAGNDGARPRQTPGA